MPTAGPTSSYSSRRMPQVLARISSRAAFFRRWRRHLHLWFPPASSLVSRKPHLASRKPPSEAACQVCLNLHSWVILPSKASLRQDVFRVKIFTVNASGEQVHTPAEICSGIHYRLAPPPPWSVRWVPLGCLMDRHAIHERWANCIPSLLPLTGCASSWSDSASTRHFDACLRWRL